MALIITFEDKTYTFDQAKINVDEWRELKRKYGITPRGFEDGIKEADPDVMTFLYWLMLRIGGDSRTPLGDQLKPDIIALNEAIADAVDTDAPEPEADPTTPGSPPDGSTRPSEGSGTGTSGNSATSTSSPSPSSADSPPLTLDG